VSPPKYESIQKKNKLLDGSYHIQIIGEPLKYIEFTVIANQYQVEKIDLIETVGERLKLIEYNNAYIGLINEPIKWIRITQGYKDKIRRLFEASIRINIKEEVIL